VTTAPQAISLQQVAFADIGEGNILSPQEVDELKPALTVSKFIGKIERDWWLSSFSALSRNLRHGGVSTPDRDSAELATGSIVTNEKTASDKNLLRFKLAKGAHSGNLLHDILEHYNFKPRDNIDNNLLDSIKWPLVKYGELTAGFNETDLVYWLDDIVCTPLFSSNKSDNDGNKNNANSFCLSDISMQKTLRESEFYFPMEKAKVSVLEKLITDHRNTWLY